MSESSSNRKSSLSDSAERKSSLERPISRSNSFFAPKKLKRAVLKSGWMSKKGEVNRAWKKRWFELTSKDLKYFKREGKAKMGSILLSDVLYCSENPELDFELNVFTKNRVYRLLADGEEDAKEWLEYISTIGCISMATVVMRDENGEVKVSRDEGKRITLVQESSDGVYRYSVMNDDVSYEDVNSEVLEYVQDDSDDLVLSEQEGVIKFCLEFVEGKAVPFEDILELNVWRKVVHQMDMIGATEERYMGFGFGNISQRYPYEDENSFVISGTQTGIVKDLTANHYCIVKKCYAEENRVTAIGPIKPSSESMTHGMVYLCDESIKYVCHVHDPIIWKYAKRLGIPTTSIDIAYGTPEMSNEVKRLFEESNVKEKKIFSMDGHEDGVITFGSNLADVVTTLQTYLAKSIQLQYSDTL